MSTYAIILLICVGLFIYIFIAKSIFVFCAKNDVFDEINCWLRGEFPTLTFFASALWIIAIPFLLICALIGWIIEEITISYQAYLEVGEELKRQKRKDK